MLNVSCNTNITPVPCPICGVIAPFAWKHPGADIYRCNACTHVFSDPATIVPEPYDPEYFSHTHMNWFSHPNLPLFRWIARGIVAHNPQSRVLDVGGGNGDFLRYLREYYPRLDLSGIDLAPDPAIPGVAWIQGGVQTNPPQGEFDAVVNLAVIEHVADVVKFTRTLRELTRPGGLMYSMTLNSDGLVFRLGRFMRRIGDHGPFNRLYAPHHYHHYTMASLAKVVQDNGFDVIAHKSHNCPLGAVDYEAAGPLMDSVHAAGVAAIFALTHFTNYCYLQTVVGRAK